MISYINMNDKSINEILSNIKKQLKEKNCKSSKTIEVNFEVKEKDIVRPKVYIPLEIQKLIEEIVAQASDEVAWNCTVDFDKESYTFTLKEFLVFPQIVTGSSVNVDDDKYIDFINSLTDEQLNTMRFHGHSHVNMNVFSSSVDDDYQRQMLAHINDFYIFGIFNKRKEHAFYVYDLKANLMFCGNDVTVVYDAVPENVAHTKVKQLLEENITKPVTNYRQSYWDGTRSGYGYNYSNRNEVPSAWQGYQNYLTGGNDYD